MVCSYLASALHASVGAVLAFFRMGSPSPCRHPAPASPSTPCPPQLTSLDPHPGHPVLSRYPYFPVLYLLSSPCAGLHSCQRCWSQCREAIFSAPTGAASHQHARSPVSDGHEFATWCCSDGEPAVGWGSQPDWASSAAAQCHPYPSFRRAGACRDSRSQHAGLYHQLSSPCLRGEGASRAKTCPPWAAAWRR